MTIAIVRLLVATALVTFTVVARAEPPPAPPAPPVAPATVTAPLQPAAPPPEKAPPAPPAPTPPSPQAQPIEPSPTGAMPRQQQQQIAPAPPAGQWVYTRQYGWLWMPYERPYTYVVPDAALAYMFVYYPGFGWRWVVAPWVLGFDVAPVWGSLGPARFAWYARPWFRVGVPYYPYRGPGWRHPPASGRAVRVPPHRR